MKTFESMSARSHEQVVFCQDEAAGLRAIIAIHDTTLGRALGGTRMWPFESEEEALRDVLRLSRGMTYKAAAAGLNLGGGKAVIIADPNKDKSEILFRAFGRFVDSLGGRYITAEDVGVDVQDMEYVRMETDHVVGISEALGGSGDPSPVTALGVYHGMKACTEEVFGSRSLKGRRVVVQGAGHVGLRLVELLRKDKAEVFISDIFEKKVKEVVEKYGATAVEPDKVYDVDADIFAPCALGGVLNDDTISRLKVKVVAGGANNQLADEKVHGKVLKGKDILYAPDYVINAGGLINVANELEGYNRDKALSDAKGIYNILKQVIKIAKEENIPTHQASNRLAERRIEGIARIKGIYTSSSRPAIRRRAGSGRQSDGR